jgi:hypothetical protein
MLLSEMPPEMPHDEPLTRTKMDERDETPGGERALRNCRERVLSSSSALRKLCEFAAEKRRIPGESTETRKGAPRSTLAAARSATLLQRLAVGHTAFVAMHEGLAVIHLRIAAAQVGARLVVRFFAICGKQCGLEAGADVGLVLIEISAGLAVG